MFFLLFAKNKLLRPKLEFSTLIVQHPCYLIRMQSHRLVIVIPDVSHYSTAS